MTDGAVASLTTALAQNPAGWPEVVLPLFERAMTVEYASLTRAGTPVTYPVTPYVGDDGLTLDVSTGLTYPAKAERARRNPKVALLYSDSMGTGLDAAPVVLVQGFATVRDADLQANTDRYVRLAIAKFPEAYGSQPKFLLRSLAWYFARIWVRVTPTRILWWPEGRVGETPREWTAPEGTDAPPSDPAPPGKQPAAWLEQPPEWRQAAEQAAREFPFRDLTFVGTDGFPVCLPVGEISPDPRGFRLRAARGPGKAPEGAACLTFHTHAPDGPAQQNRAVVGRISPTDEGTLVFEVERLLGNWNVSQNRLGFMFDFMFLKGRRLRPRLKAESARRSQPVPEVRLPGE
jgi:hypothetical protein